MSRPWLTYLSVSSIPFRILVKLRRTSRRPLMIGSQLSSTASFPTSSALPLLTAPPLPCTKHTLYHGTPYDRGGILPHGTVWSLQVLTCVFLQQEHLFWEDFHANHPHPHRLPTPSPVRQPSWAPIAAHSHELLFSVFSCLFCPETLGKAAKTHVVHTVSPTLFLIHVWLALSNSLPRDN